MRCDKCGEVISDFSDICYKCNKSNITAQLDGNKEIKCPDFSPGNETCILEQNKYSSYNKRTVISSEPDRSDYRQQSLPHPIIEQQLPYNLSNPAISKLAVTGIVVSAIFFIFITLITQEQKKFFNKGISQLRQGIFRTYRNGDDFGSPASFKKAFSIWNTNEYNGKISYLLAVSCYYDYLSLQVIGARNDPLRIRDDMDEMKLYLDKALSLNHKYPEAFYYRGLYYLEINDYSQARADFNNSMQSAGLIWRSDPVKQLKWINAARNAEEEALKLSKDVSIKAVPPITGDFCGNLRVISDGKGRASIKDNNGNFIITDKLCPPLPDEMDR